jgi:hypothetical protein
MSKDEVAKGGVRRKRFEVAMDGYQPARDDVTKGYRVTQQIDMRNLKIPKNLRSAAVVPRNSGNSARTSVEPKKE